MKQNKKYKKTKDRTSKDIFDNIDWKTISCICCQKRFRSPNPKIIKICNYCKSSERNRTFTSYNYTKVKEDRRKKVFSWDIFEYFKLKAYRVTEGKEVVLIPQMVNGEFFFTLSEIDP